MPHKLHSFTLITMMTTTFSLIGMAIASCTPDTSAPTLPDLTPALQSTQVAQGNPLDAILEELTIPTIPPFTDTECLTCHTDQGQLTDLAVEVENLAEGLSSGPG